MKPSPKPVRFANNFFTIEDLTSLTREQKEEVLMWFARKLWVLLGKWRAYHCKHYDPLVIEGNIAHSYVFNLDDGGRHHEFRDLEHLEKMMMDEGIRRIETMIGVH